MPHAVLLLSLLPFLLPLSAAPLAAAAEPGDPYLVRDIDLTGEPYFEPCHITCVPPTPIYGSMIEQLTPLGELLVFVASDRIHGFEPWVSDGTAEGTRMLADTCPGPCDEASPQILGALDGRLFFSAAGEPRLWITDGTPEGTRSLDELCPGLCAGSIILPDAATVFEGSLFFQVYELGGSPRGRYLWRTDGTPGGTARVQAVCDRPSGCWEQFGTFFELGGRLFYTDLSSLWRLGSPGAPPVEAWSGAPSSASSLGSGVILAVSGSDPSLWMLDGPLAEPRLVTHVGGEYLSQLTRAGDHAYFVRRNADGVDEALWRTDGTAAGTGPVVPSVRGGVQIVGLLGGDPIVRVFPAAGTPPTIFSYLRRIDPTGGAETLSRRPVQSVAVVGDRVFFSAEDGGSRDRELWVSDGTAAGTRLHADIAPGAASSEPGNGGRFVVGFARAGDRLFFPAHHPDTDTELWALDLGTEEPPPPPPPPPPSTEWLESAEVPGFRVQVRITGGGASVLGRKEPVCIPETLCVSGALAGRSEVFVRMVGPKPNGFLWPTLVKFSTSRVEVWIEQESSGVVRYYRLEGASPGVDVLPGLFDRTGFSP